MLLDLAKRINAKEIAVKEHVPDSRSIYLLSDLENQKIIEISAEEFAKDKILKTKDYYSCVLNINKCVDKKKKIHSNNKYSFFTKNPLEITEDIISNYYKALDCSMEEIEKYTTWFLKNKEKLTEYKKPVKVFFNADVNDFIESGGKYFYDKVFADTRNIDFDEYGNEIGAPLTLNTNEKKTYEIINPTKLKYSVMYTREDCYLIKCMLDLFKSLNIQGYDKAYFYNNTYTPVKIGQILQENIPPAEFIRFELNSRGTINISDMESISFFRINNFNKKMFYYYKNIEKLFFNGDLYNTLINRVSPTAKNAREKNMISTLIERWFFKGVYPNYLSIRQIERQLSNIAKNEFSEDYDKTITRACFIKELLSCVEN